jgi:hypothetical protein
MLSQRLDDARSKKIYDSLLTSEPFKMQGQMPLTMDTF